MTMLHRRNLLTGLCGCAMLGLTGCVTTMAQDGPMQVGYKPAENTDEGGLWHIVNKAEADAKRSRHLMRDKEWNEYLVGIVNRLAGEHAKDIRVYLLRTAQFNATMAPNGMMQVWSGLLVRVDDEAQLAAVIGHEIGHYIQRHTLARMRAVRSRADLGVFLSMGFGLAGSVAGMMLMADAYAFSRDQEREADAIGVELMQRAGYAPLAASEVWQNIIAENSADPNKKSGNILFASHPGSEERKDTLRKMATDAPAGERHAARYAAAMRSIRGMLLEDEIRLRQPERSLVVLERLLKAAPEDGELHFFVGEVYRVRDADKDRDLAMAAYDKAAASEGPPPALYRSIGMVEQKRGNASAAKAAFNRYLELQPQAEDRLLIQRLMEPLS